MLFEVLKSCLFPFSSGCEKGTKSGAKETPGSPLPIGLHEVHLARVRVYVLERGYASGLRESSKLFGTTKLFDEKFAGKVVFPCAAHIPLLSLWKCCGR